MKYDNKHLLLLALTTVAVLAVSHGQISTPCTNSIIKNFTPCLNFITGSSSNGGSPTTGCCEALKSMMTDSVDCACLIITGNVPIPLPINRTLAISLPSICQYVGTVPIQCHATAISIPAPGPILFGPSSSAKRPGPAPVQAPTDHLLPPMPPPLTSPSPKASKAVVSSAKVAPTPATSSSEAETRPPLLTPKVSVVRPNTASSPRSGNLSPVTMILLPFVGTMLFLRNL
ncbi:non-specific lipid transfer protein GPI-anchored 16-like [Impatiens glandulifera]|uniref:non-specific lipid transfer protein GPI-anchored 16-like n=1 Tax=Impatiens glandulifera TaxID=253017 RepID=UPI001FB111F7|nr:non-specific lipid transfer protein GPI-anchored 16-like [Impatiens glandulifera]